MKLQFFTTLLLIFICNISNGQDLKNELVSLKNIDAQIQGNEYSSDIDSGTTDRLVVKTSVKNISKKDKQFFSKKEWKKIKKQLLRNKKRISKTENAIHTHKTIDTVYVDIKPFSRKSSLSDL